MYPLQFWEEHAQIQEVKQEEAASETLPELEEVKEQLTEEELVYAEDLTIKAGEPFDLETDYRGFQKNDEKVKVTFLKAEGAILLISIPQVLTRHFIVLIR